MKARWIVSACLWMLWASAVGAQAMQIQVEAALQTIPGRLEALGIPGVAVAVVQDSRVIALRGFGVSDPDLGIPVDAVRDLFRVGSVSKPVTATAVLRLVARGDLDLHQDLRSLLGGLPVQPQLTMPLTLHHLLTHTAGFNERLFGQHAARQQDVLSLNEYLERHLPPRFAEPGMLLAYNDHHTALAGWIVEQRTGRRFEDLVAAEVFEPLGMTSSTFEQVNLPAELESRLTRSWRQTQTGFKPYPRDYVHLTPAAGLYTTAEDMTRYLSALIDCESGPLGAGICVQLTRQFAHHERLPGRAYGFAESTHAGMRVLYKDGQASGFNARLLLVPEQRFGMFVVHNRSILGAFGQFEDASRFNRELTRSLLDELWPETDSESVSVPIPLPDAGVRAAGYAGTYRTVIAARHTWERLASLFDDVRVTATESGVRLGTQEYVEIEPGLLQWQEGGDRYLIFEPHEGEVRNLFIGGGAYERVPWFTASWSAPWLVGAVCVWLMLGSLLLSRMRRRFADHAAGPGWGLLTNAALLGFVLGLVAVFGLTDPQDFFKGPTPALLALLALPVLAAGGVVLQIWHLRDGSAGLLGRWPVLINVTVALLFLLWLDYWNLFGYRFG